MMKRGIDHVDDGSSVGCVAGLAHSSRGPHAGNHRRVARVDGGVQPLRSDARRARDLAVCQLFFPHELGNTVLLREHVISRLDLACRNDRTRGIEGHWSYCPARHAGMLDLLKIERRELAQIKAEVRHGR